VESIWFFGSFARNNNTTKYGGHRRVPIAVAGHAFHLVPRTRDMEDKDALLRDAALFCTVLSRTEPGGSAAESRL
jgi:hypothetical protein